MTTLVIGNKNYSSWSLRPWLAMRHLGIPFEEVLIPLDRPDTKERIRAWSPSGRVPLLIDGDVRVWESLAILEYLADRHPELGLWPRDLAARAHARAVAAEMHAGFAALRGRCPMNVRRRVPHRDHGPEVAADVARIVTLWHEVRGRYGASGPFLFGAFTAADAMYAPVVSRFVTYDLTDDPVARAYVEAVTALPAYAAWQKSAEAEPWVLEAEELD